MSAAEPNPELVARLGAIRERIRKRLERTVPAAPAPVERGEMLEVTFAFACRLTPQEYTLTVATQSADGTSHDWLDDVLTFQVVDTRRAAGIANLAARVSSRKLPARSPIPA